MSLDENLTIFDPTLIILAKKYYSGFFNQFAYLSWEDIAQDLRIRIFEQYAHFTQGKNFNNWAYVVCVNHLKNKIKAQHAIKRGLGMSFTTQFEVEFKLRLCMDINGDKVEMQGPQYVEF
jgi:DNA-directed RNA polymerase specialized sigma24 family protein